MEKTATEKSDFGACPKCGSTNRQSGCLKAAEMVPLQFETDTLRSVSDNGPVRGVVCTECRHLELFVA